MIIPNKNLSVITDFYFNMFSKCIRIFLQYNQRWYPATALKPGHIRRFYPCNIRYFLLRHFLSGILSWSPTFAYLPIPSQIFLLRNFIIHDKFL